MIRTLSQYASLWANAARSAARLSPAFSPPSITTGPAKPAETAAWALRPRLDALDFLRGLVMIIMVLDHARDFFGAKGFNPRDVHEPALFLTRWITHFCAPVFVFLAGISAFLYATRGRTKPQLSVYLLTRGLFLIAMELTLVRLAWTFDLQISFLVFQVIWVIGTAMVVLAALVHLERWAVAGFGLVLVLGHNLLDSIKADQFGAGGWLWNFLHAPAMLHPAGGITVVVLYPLVPWVGVMALGYAFAPVLLLSEPNRQRRLLSAGVLMTVGFVALRASNFYGDPTPWKVQDSPLATVLSFINCEKYPPSLLYLAMTLGPALFALSLFRHARNALTRAIVTMGRVPFLLYVVHLFALHVLAVLLALAATGDAAWLFGGMALRSKPAGYGIGLPAIYALWLAVVIALYPLCRWFAVLKQRRKDWWLSYL